MTTPGLPTVWRLDRLSTEWVGPITVTDNGTPLGILVGPGTDNDLTAPGTYVIRVRYVDSPEAPVIVAGLIVIT